MSNEAQVTQNHAQIKRWAEERDGYPAVVLRKNGEKTTILRIGFRKGGKTNTELAELTWDHFFEIFDRNKIGFLRQEKLASGKPSRFFKFISA